MTGNCTSLGFDDVCGADIYLLEPCLAKQLFQALVFVSLDCPSFLRIFCLDFDNTVTLNDSSYV